jgi:autotransporter adhesin
VDIGDLQVTEAKLADNAVSTRTIQDGAVTFAKLSPAVQSRILKLEDDVEENEDGIAMAMAMSNIPQVNNPGQQFTLGVGMGVFRDSAAIAAGITAKITDNVHARVSIAGSDEGVGFGAGIGIGF